MRTGFVVAALAVFLFLQAIVADRLAIGPVRPDFLILFTAYFALHRGAAAGSVLGFVAGFVQDLSNPSLLGLNALTKTLLGYGVGRMGAQTFPESAWVLFGVLFVASFGHDAVYLLVYHWPHAGRTVVALLTEALPGGLYTALAGSLLHRGFVAAERTAVRLGGKAG